MTDTYLALDIGGTNFKYGLVAADGRILKKSLAPMGLERGLGAVIDDMVTHLEALAESGEPRPRGLGVGSAGTILPAEGYLVWAHNLPGFKDIPLAPMLADRLGMDVRIVNDGDLHALGEWLAGAGRGLDNMACLTLGTGVGGGLVLSGRLWSGARRTAAEIGHIIVDPDGKRCACGSRGCLETWASATAMTRMAREAMNRGCPCGYRGRPEDLTAKDLFDLATRGDLLAVEIFDTAGWALGIALTGLFNVLGLEGAFIGGGAAMAFPFMEARLRREFNARVLAVDPAEVIIAQATLGLDAPLAGVPALFRAA